MKLSKMMRIKLLQQHFNLLYSMNTKLMNKNLMTPYRMYNNKLKNILIMSKKLNLRISKSIFSMPF